MRYETQNIKPDLLGTGVIVTELAEAKDGSYPPYALSYLWGDQKDIASYKEFRLTKSYKDDSPLAAMHKYIHELVCMLDMAGPDVEIPNIGKKLTDATYALIMNEQLEQLIRYKGNCNVPKRSR